MKLPKATKLPSGSWRIQLRLDGESISITEPTEQACIKKARLIKAEHLAGATRNHDVRLTLDKLLARYIKSKAPVLSPSTVRGYEAIRRTRFLAYKDKEAERINWQRMINDESELCGPKTLRNAWALVSAAAASAGLQTPPVRLPQLVQDEHPYLEAEQIPAFLEAVKDTPWELPALLGLHGLRRSEMFALTWNQIDLKTKTIRVAGAMVHDKDGKLISKKTNKNRSSRRTVPIMIPRLADLLACSGAQCAPSSPVLTCHPNSVYKAINRICEKEGLPLIGVHGLRHSFASLAHSLGVPEAETMALGGWEDPNTMRKIYTHLDAAARLKASNKISAFFNPDPPREQKS